MQIAPTRLAGLVIAFLGLAPALSAQSFQVSPFYGYRFGGSFVDLYTAQPFDLDGAPATGVAFDVRISDNDDFQIEGLFTHQAADVVLGYGRQLLAQWAARVPRLVQQMFEALERTLPRLRLAPPPGGRKR